MFASLSLGKLRTDYFLKLVLIIAAMKLFLAAVTPFGFDFVLYLSAVLANDKSVSWSPWIIFVRGVYYFWLWLPIHNNDTQFLTSVLFASETNFLMPTHYLLTALVKVPLVLCDFGIGYLVYLLGTHLSASRSLGRRAALLWLANPFGTLFIEMWGTIDAIMIFLTLLSIFLVLNGRTRLGSLAVFSGIAVRLSPVIAWLSMTSWLLGKKSSRMNLLAVIVAGPLGVAAYLYWSSQGQFFYNFISFMSSTQLFSSYTPVTQTFSEYTGSELYQLFVTPGFAVMGVTAFYLVAQEVFPKGDWTLVTMTLSGMLLVYGLGDWFPTAFLWSMPFIALINSLKGRYSCSMGFYALLMIYLLTFYNLELSSHGVSFLFIPENLIPFGPTLAAALMGANVLRQLGLDFLVRSAFAGVSIAYSASIIWRTLARRSN